MSWFELADSLRGQLDDGRISECSERIAEALAKLPPSPFHIATELDFNNDPMAVAHYFDTFILRESKRFEVCAVYTETNDFNINPDRWFFDLFAYDKDPESADFDGLSAWQSRRYDDMTLTGMERLQEVYASDAFRDAANEEAADLAALWVVVRFQALINRSAPYMKELQFPLLATSHDYEFIYAYRSEHPTASPISTSSEAAGPIQLLFTNDMRKRAELRSESTSAKEALALIDEMPWQELSMIILRNAAGVELEASGSHEDGFSITYTASKKSFISKSAPTLQDVKSVVGKFASSDETWRSVIEFEYWQNEDGSLDRTDGSGCAATVLLLVGAILSTAVAAAAAIP